MTIRKGEEWGTLGDRDASWPVAGDDRSAGRLAGPAVLAGAPITVVLRGGDLFRSIGSPRRTTEPGGPTLVRLLPVDALVVTHDGGRDVALAHVVVGRGLWRPESLVAMNCTHLRDLDLGPRAHPDDGLVDVTDGALPWRDRVLARRRARSGSHVPHPSLHVRRVTGFARTFSRPQPLRIDGDRVGTTRSVAVEVLPDAVTIAV